MTHDAWKYLLEMVANLLTLLCVLPFILWETLPRLARRVTRRIRGAGASTMTAITQTVIKHSADSDQIITLAAALGNADAAVVLWTFQKWMAANKARHSKYHFHQGRWWVYTGVAHLSADHFPWISEPKMARLLTQLSKEGLLLRERFDVGSPSSIYWYSVDEDALAQRVAALPQPDPSRRVFHGDALPHGIREYDGFSEFPRDVEEDHALGAPPKRTRQIQEGYVYLLKGANGLHKIGLSTDAERRLKDFETLPFDVEYICVIETPDMRGLEAFLHKRFVAKRVRGEWFNLDAEDVDYIRSLTLGGL